MIKTKLNVKTYCGCFAILATVASMYYVPINNERQIINADFSHVVVGTCDGSIGTRKTTECKKKSQSVFLQ
jgi:hypothetical protein